MPLRGHLYGSGGTGVILAHMFPADQSDWTDFAQVLAAHGYTALTFDFRGFTESEGSSGTEFADRDLLAAYRFFRPRVSRIFIAGASLGAEAAILVAARDPVAGIICISTPVSFGGLNVQDAIRRVRAPILFVTSADDPLVAGQPEILYRLATAPKSFEVFPGRAHGTAILFGPSRHRVAEHDAAIHRRQRFNQLCESSVAAPGLLREAEAPATQHPSSEQAAASCGIFERRSERKRC